MRTTIDLPNDLRAKLMALAARRGMRGYSEIVREAVARYLWEEEKKEAGVDEILSLAGSLTDEEAEEARKRIEEAWNRWRL